MAKKSKLTRLACRYLPLAVLLLELANNVFDLVSKVVNYAYTFREFRLFVLLKGPAGI